MNYLNYFNILEISQNASKEEIRSAYLKKVKEYHPDLHPNDSSATYKFQLLVEAYNYLYSRSISSKSTPNSNITMVISEEDIGNTITFISSEGKILNINIPSNLDNGDKLRVKGKGKEGKDLIITFYINEKL